MACSKRIRIYDPFPKIRLKCGLHKCGSKKKLCFYLKNNISNGKRKKNGLYPCVTYLLRTKKYKMKGKNPFPKRQRNANPVVVYS